MSGFAEDMIIDHEVAIRKRANSMLKVIIANIFLALFGFKMPHYALLRVNGIESDHIHEIAAPFMTKVFPGQKQQSST